MADRVRWLAVSLSPSRPATVTVLMRRLRHRSGHRQRPAGHAGEEVDQSGLPIRRNGLPDLRARRPPIAHGDLPTIVPATATRRSPLWALGARQSNLQRY